MNKKFYEVEKELTYREPKWWDPAFSKLDIYYRPSPQKKPVIVFIHGGGWVAGDKSIIEKKPGLLNFFLNNGFIVASINFRLIDEKSVLKTNYRHQAEDIARSIKWLSEHVQNYKGLTDQFFLLGYSSGAHLASLVATDTSYLKNEKLSIDHIRAVIALDVHAYDVPLALNLMQGTSLEAMIPFNQSIFGETRKEQLKASPSYYVFNSKIPFLLISTGLKDGKIQAVTKAVTESFKCLLLKSGHRAIHRHYKERSHETFLLAFANKNDSLCKNIADFIGQIAKNNRAFSFMSNL